MHNNSSNNKKKQANMRMEYLPFLYICTTRLQNPTEWILNYLNLHYPKEPKTGAIITCTTTFNDIHGMVRAIFKGTVSLYSPGALLKIEIRHFDGPVFPYTLRAPRQYTSFYLVRNSSTGEVESLPWRTLCSLQISTLDRSNLQTFRSWKPYISSFLPEYS